MGISPIQLLIVLVIVVLIFGGRRLRSLGSDLGEAIKGFKEATKDDKQDLVSTEKVTHEENTSISSLISNPTKPVSTEKVTPEENPGVIEGEVKQKTHSSDH